MKLGAIEAVARLSDGVKQAACVYQKEKNKILLFYVGDCEEAELRTELKNKMPRYMQPHRVRKLSEMPYTPNGKIDRKTLKERYLSARKDK